MTLRELLRLIGEFFDNAIIFIRTLISDLWNKILDAPLWTLAIIGFASVGAFYLNSYFRKREEEAERKRIKKMAKEFWKDAADKDGSEG